MGQAARVSSKVSLYLGNPNDQSTRISLYLGPPSFNKLNILQTVGAGALSLAMRRRPVGQRHALQEVGRLHVLRWDVATALVTHSLTSPLALQHTNRPAPETETSLERTGPGMGPAFPILEELIKWHLLGMAV